MTSPVERALNAGSVALLAIVTEITFGALARASAPRGMTVER